MICDTQYYKSIPKEIRQDNDCTIIAFMRCFNTTYDRARDYLKKHGKPDNKGMFLHDLVKAFKGLQNNKAIEVFYSNRKVKPLQCKKFVEQHPEGTYYILYNTHAAAVVDGVLYDHKDSSRRFVKVAWKIERIIK